MNQSIARVLPWLAVFLLCSLQGALFVESYRMSADDAGFLQALMKGYPQVWQAGAADAHAQGRLGMYLIRPLNTLASYWSAYPPARIGFVLLYFANFLLFARHIAKLLRADIQLLLFSILVIAHPLALEHMPPTAYPLQNTLPVLLLLLSRMALVAKREAPGGRRAVFPEATALCVFALAMGVSEYAFVFGISLLAVEYGAQLIFAVQEGATMRRALERLSKNMYFLVDLFVAALMFSAYAIFRGFNPSQYDGNSPDGIGQPARVLFTMLGHMAAGTIFPRLDHGVVTLPASAMLTALASGALAFFCLFGAVRQTGGAIRYPALVGLGSLLLAMFISLPLAITRKQQAWCLEGHTCGFLDSRISYLWLCVVGVCVIVLLWKLLARRLPASIIAFAFGLGGAGVAVMGYTHNWRQARQMAAASQAWQRADAVACYPAGAPATDDALRAMIDYRNAVLFHPDVSKGEYWREYISSRAMRFSCPDTAQDRQALFRKAMESSGLKRTLRLGEEVSFSQRDGEDFLDSHWSSERWGVWSMGKRSALKVRLADAPQSVVFSFEALRHESGIGNKPVVVSVNGQPMGSVSLTSRAQQYRIRIPGSVLRLSSDGITIIEFLVADPSSPARDGSGLDKRPLGVGLVKMQLDPDNG